MNKRLRKWLTRSHVGNSSDARRAWVSITFYLGFVEKEASRVARR
jgi:hypothetical protein